MLNQQTINKLYELKLTGMADAFADQIKQPDMDRLSFAERFGLIVDRQWTCKENNRMDRYLKNARLKLDACVEDAAVDVDDGHLSAGQHRWWWLLGPPAVSQSA